MKKITIIFAALVLLFSTSAFAATGDEVTKEVKTAFIKNFAGAIDVSWQVTDDWYFVSFQLDGKKTEAAYNEKGELLGTSKKLHLSEIPSTVSEALKISFPDYTISSSVTEIVYDGQTFYYASALGETRNLSLKCFSDGQIYIEKRMKK
ncbi:MAG: hypothetical protein ABIO04_08530 [Ferruginibacter sp.]